MYTKIFATLAVFEWVEKEVEPSGTTTTTVLLPPLHSGRLDLVVCIAAPAGLKGNSKGFSLCLVVQRFNYKRQCL